MSKKKWIYKEMIVAEHPATRPNGRVYEHRIVAEAMLKRSLRRREVVHHIDNDPTNNEPSNLMVFASNADHIRFHHGGRAIKQDDGAYKVERVVRTHPCARCNRPCSLRLRYCSPECYYIASRRAVRPSKSELSKMVKTMSMLAIGHQFGVSDNAVRKWLRAYGLK
jgi:hypothetical protein